MVQISRFWDGHTTGDATDSPYTDLDYAETEAWKFTRGEGDQGVIYGVLNNILVAADVMNTHVHVLDGIALVNGRLYYNNDIVAIAISGVSRWWVIGLFSDESAHTIRAFGRGNYATEAAAKASITQTPGGDWELLLATVQTDGAELISLVNDYRMWAIRARCNDFVPAVGGRNVTDATDLYYDLYGVPLANSHICSAFGQYRIPHRYHTNLTVTPMFVAENLGNANLKTDVYYGKIGEEAYNAHTATIGYFTETVGLFEMFDAYQPTLTDIVEGGGDFLCISTSRDAVDADDTVDGDVHIAGWHVVYDALF